MAAGDEKLVEYIFNGSVMLLAVLIAVAGIAAASYDKISGQPDVEPSFRWFLWFIAGLSVLASIVSWLALEKTRGRAVPIGLVLWSLRILVMGAGLASVGIVWITVY